MMAFEGVAVDNNAASLLAFLNSDDEDGSDLLGSEDALRSWLDSNGRPGIKLAEDDARRARRVRAALRDYIASLHGAEPDERTITLLNDLTQTAGMHLHVEPGGRLTLRSPASGLDALFVELLVSLHEMSRDGTLARLKLCKGCPWAFLDHSKNRSRVWCDMSTCGAQSKVRAYRQRQQRIRQ